MAREFPMNGEGFAYNCWHRLKWPQGNGQCSRRGRCYFLWVTGQRHRGL